MLAVLVIVDSQDSTSCKDSMNATPGGFLAMRSHETDPQLIMQLFRLIQVDCGGPGAQWPLEHNPDEWTALTTDKVC